MVTVDDSIKAEIISFVVAVYNFVINDTTVSNIIIMTTSLLLSHLMQIPQPMVVQVKSMALSLD